MHERQLPLLLLLLLPLSCQCVSSLTSYVDPFLASRGGSGFGGWGPAHRNPGAMAPFPFLRLGPDTTRVDPVLGEVWSHLNRHAGYFGSDTHVRAFSHTHVQGAGDSDYGNVGVMAARAPASAISAMIGVRPLALFDELILDRSPFRQPVVLGHAGESAHPGYYSTELQGIGVRAELVASGVHAGAHRYTCASGTPPGSGGGAVSGPCALVVDVCHRTHSNACGAASYVDIAPSQSSPSSWIVSGAHQDVGEFVRFNYTGVMVYFYMIVSAEQLSAGGGGSVSTTDQGLWREYAFDEGAVNATVGVDRDSLGAYFVYPPPAGTGAENAVVIEVRVGLSTVSVDAARANLIAEQSQGGDGNLTAFDAVVSAIDAEWESLLGSVTVTPVADAATGSDADALAAGFQRAQGGRLSKESRDGGDSDGAAMSTDDAVLASFLATPDGVALAITHGWADVPLLWLDAIALARAQGIPRQPASALLRMPVGSPARPPLRPVPAAPINVTRASFEIRAAVATSRASAAALRANDPAGTDLTIFYTMVYLSFCAPSTYSDADGRYLGFDSAVHDADVPTSAFVSDLSLWDIHRSQSVWLALAAPRALADIAGSLLSMTAQGDRGMPRWPFANLYTEDMVGRHGVIVLVDCVLTSTACAGRVSLRAAADAATTAIVEQDESSSAYVNGGFIPVGEGSASETLEWAYDDFAAALLAGAAGNASVEAALLSRAQNWRNVFDAALPAVAPRFTNGTFFEGTAIWNPHPFNSFYTEGNAAHWMWSVPHNLTGLFSAFPTTKQGASFSEQLHVVLANQTFWPFGTFLPNPYAWLGNEPSMNLPWLFAVSTDPADAAAAAFWPRWHLREYYIPTADCIPGNDDYGTLSTWAVFAYLGIYPVAATGDFLLGSPVFADARIAVRPGYGPYSGDSTPTLHIVAHNASTSAIYVVGVRANGVALAAPRVSWQQLFGGGGDALLEFDMAEEPAPWGRGMPPL